MHSSLGTLSHRRKFEEDKPAIRGEVDDTHRTRSLASRSDGDTILPACRKVVPLCAGEINC